MDEPNEEFYRWFASAIMDIGRMKGIPAEAVDRLSTADGMKTLGKIVDLVHADWRDEQRKSAPPAVPVRRMLSEEAQPLLTCFYEEFAPKQPEFGPFGKIVSSAMVDSRYVGGERGLNDIRYLQGCNREFPHYTR